jgi:hypothetical protein
LVAPPIHFAPSEIMEMTVPEMLWWLEVLNRRLEKIPALAWS